MRLRELKSKRNRGTHTEGFGRSLGGFTSKIHSPAGSQGRPIGVVLAGGEASDYKTFDDLLALPVAKPRLTLADKNYDSDDVRASLLLEGILSVVPLKANHEEAIVCDDRVYKDTQSGRAHGQQAQADPAHRNPIRQNRRLIPWLLAFDAVKLLDAELCQQDLYSAESALYRTSVRLERKGTVHQEASRECNKQCLFLLVL